MSPMGSGGRFSGAVMVALIVAAVRLGSVRTPEDIVLRDATGAATCIVTDWTASSVTVLVRRPNPPAAELTATLPEGMRDFSNRPISVLLLPSTVGSAAASQEPRRPSRLDPSPTYPVVAGTIQQIVQAPGC